MENLLEEYDFLGYATKNDTLCTDGVTIRHGAFSDNEGKVVPLVWSHNHSEPENIIGKALLHNDDVGTLTYGKFNSTAKGKMAKELVMHQDIYALSIGANRIKRTPDNDVIHGNIYEVSLVVSGANPGAVITKIMQHSDSEGESIIMENVDTIQHSNYSGEEKSIFLERLAHAETEEDAASAIDTVMDTLNPDQQAAVAILMDAVAETAVDNAMESVRESYEQDVQEGVEEVLDDLADEYDEEEYDEEVKQSALGGNTMYYNAFEQGAIAHNAQTELEHSEIRNELTHAIEEAQKTGRRLSEVVHSMDSKFDNSILEHSVNNVEYLFPEHTAPQGVQVIYSTNTATEHILGSVSKVPTAFVKSILSDLSDLTDEQLRAKGYIKGNEKKEQVISFLTRKTDPKTIYKKQSIDRDDAIDISTSLNVAAFFAQEMRIKLNDEIAQAILVGDGRETGAEGKIDESKIRPIKNDADFYTIKAVYDDKLLIDIFQTVSDYRNQMHGSGTPSLYVNPSMLTKLRFLRNEKTGQWVFGGQQPATKEYLASLFGVKEIVETRFLNDGEMIMVNLADYQIGTNKGGEVNTFEKFDIDYNKQKYLIETRLSGALVQAKSAVYFKPKSDKKSVTPDASANPQ